MTQFCRAPVIDQAKQVSIQCRHLIPALNAWAARAYYTTARPVATQFPWHGGTYDLTIGHGFDSQAKNVGH